MELTLQLPPAEAAGIARLRLLKPLRAGRARSQPWRVVWHDSPDRALAAQGLALADQDRVWRLERHRPREGEAWPPAGAARLEAVADSLAGLGQVMRGDLGQELPGGLAQTAGFEGRRVTVPLAADGAAVTMTIFEGVARAAAAEHRAARLILEGDDPAVRRVLDVLNEGLTLSVPADSLAMDALRLAGAEPPPPARSGAPILAAEGLSTASAFAHIVGHLTSVILGLAAPAADAESGPEPVHQMRVAVRRARSALSLFAAAIENPALPRVSEALRHFGRVLGPARDWDVFMTETLPPAMEALPDQPGLLTLERAGARRRIAAHSALTAWLSGPEFRRMTLDLACIAAVGPPREGEAAAPALPDFTASVLHGLWKKVKSTGKSLRGLDDPGLHGLRLKAKRLRYAAEFFAPLYPEKTTTRFIRRLAGLQENLGIFNDSTVAEGLLRELSERPGYAAGLVLGFTAARGAGIRPRIAGSWGKLRKRDPFWE